ncbi:MULTISPECIES: WGR domain-containing protein [Zooshikella]|uniref:WGR domain-containing protein n=2 Tax=Zooshikella ganghwensis TaxID=202772 RepID=A0A4P9VEZ3_9GAMM|nr:WGR domain-containing protein [Zooshikella ganghwensis]MBU2709060.1 WGR domain-containing protein [Zooshikella ganghwensis]RDH41638.1 WGR domain-containing protein [Zooshikella ganghwensis]RDH41805.1 WGR domain-containing protein [Zooshikella ganghwensis]
MILMHKINAETNENKYYSLHIQPDLFGHWSLMRYFGRIGKNGQLKVDSFESEEEARELYDKLEASKKARGYFEV